jgi:hypothetical protein
VASTLKLPYGLRDGNLIHISEAANGLACQCICPGCSAPLVARNQGKQKVPHFAHHQTAECSTGLQTALHLAAKDIIAKHKRLRLPGTAGYFPFTDTYWSSFSFDAKQYQYDLRDRFEAYYDEDEDESYYETEDLSRYYFKAQLVKVDEVTLEKKTGDIVPDIMVRIGERQLIVEVAVTHFVDDTKRAKIKGLGLPALEIDLSKVKRDLDEEDLERLLIEGIDRKKWVNNPALRAELSKRRQAYFEACRPEFERLHSEAQQRDAKRLAREKWKAELAAKSVEEQSQIERQKQEFYSRHWKPITRRIIGNAEPIRHVDYCPKQIRLFFDKFYANLEHDCFKCHAFRGYSPQRTAIVCLFNYLKNKEEGGPS